MSELVQENTRIIPNQQTSLTKEQKEAVGLLNYVISANNQSTILQFPTNVRDK